MYRRMSEVAANNPFAWNRRAVSEAEILDATGKNRMLAFPYSVLHNASWSVDQATALLLCSEATADRHGIPREHRVYPLSSSESNHITSVSSRVELGSCPGARIAGHAALDHAGLATSQLDHIDLYSCFPVAVETYAAALGVPLDSELTVTGGMPFAGGPFNNYVLQSTATMANVLRRRAGSCGMVTSVSGVLTKQGFGVWRGAMPNTEGFSSFDVSEQVAAVQSIKPVVEGARGTGRIVGLTVLTDRQPARAVAVIDLDGDVRTVAYSEDPGIVGAFQTSEHVGHAVEVNGAEFVAGRS